MLLTLTISAAVLATPQFENVTSRVGLEPVRFASGALPSTAASAWVDLDDDGDIDLLLGGDELGMQAWLNTGAPEWRFEDASAAFGVESINGVFLDQLYCVRWKTPNVGHTGSDEWRPRNSNFGTSQPVMHHSSEFAGYCLIISLTETWMAMGTMISSRRSELCSIFPRSHRSLRLGSTFQYVASPCEHRLASQGLPRSTSRLRLWRQRYARRNLH